MAVSNTKQQGRRLATERRRFIRTAGGMAVGLGLLADANEAFGQRGGGITQGDAAVLRFLAAAEIIETDLWLQYAELGGTQDNQLPGLPTGGSSAYTAALANLDADMPQYIHDNTRDELSHETFINAFLESKGAELVDLDQFRTSPSSRATGANQVGRLTNLMQLTVDTSWYTRYRDTQHNPDLVSSLRVSASSSKLEHGAVSGDPHHRRRSHAEPPYSGDRRTRPRSTSP